MRLQVRAQGTDGVADNARTAQASTGNDAELSVSEDVVMRNAESCLRGRAEAGRACAVAQHGLGQLFAAECVRWRGSRLADGSLSLRQLGCRA